MKFAPDNKSGMILLNRLAASPLRKKDQEFVSSVMRQVLARPTSFRLSEKQLFWLIDIARRHHIRED